jgi:hypothetical protein
MAQSPVDFDDLSVVNAALAAIRAQPIASLDSDETRVRSCAALYWPLIDHLLSAARWYFANRLYKLTVAASTVDRRGWTYAHTLPADRIGPPQIVFTDPASPRHMDCYELTEREILSDEATIYVRVPHRPKPVNWPGYFRSLVIEAMAAKLAVPIRGDDGLAKAHELKAFGPPQAGGRGGMMKDAIDLDHAARPQEVLDTGAGFGSDAPEVLSILI